MQIFPEELIAKIRAAIDPERLLWMLDYRTETIQNMGNTIKSFCPIHREPIFRTLLIDTQAKTFQCTNPQCSGYEGGDMIDLYARSRGIGYDEAMPELAKTFDVEIGFDFAEEYLRRAQEIADNYLEMGANDDAEEQYKRILHFQPRAFDAMRGLINLYKRTGQDAEVSQTTLRLAGALIQDGEDAQAAPLLQEYVAANPGDTPTRLLYLDCLERLGDEEWTVGEYINLADHLASEGDIDRAIEIYRRIEEMELESIDVSPHIVQILGSAGRQEEAVAELLNQSDRFLKREDPNGAVRCVKSALDVDPANDELKIRLARLVASHRMTGDPLDEAIHQIQRMLESRAHGPASQALDCLVEVFADHLGVLELKGDLEEARGHDESTIEIRLQCADQYEKRKEYERALEVLDKVIHGHEENVIILSRRANLLRELDRVDEAVHCYLKIASLFETADDLDHASAIYQTVIDLQPDEIDHRARQFDLYVRMEAHPLIVSKGLPLVEAYRARGDLSEAERLLARALSAAADSPDLLTRHGEILEELGRKGEAAEQFLAAARIFIDQELHDRARHWLDRSLQCLPEHMTARELRADVLAAQEMTIQAISEYEQLASKFLEAGGYEPAIRVAEKVLRIQPGHLDTLQILVQAYGHCGDVEKRREAQMNLVQLYRRNQSYTHASDLCEEVLTEDPDHAPALEQLIAITENTRQSGGELSYLWKLARVYARTGRREDEQSILDRILEHDPLHGEAWRRSLELIMQTATPAHQGEMVDKAIDRFLEASRPDEVLRILEQLAAAPSTKPEILGGLVRLRRINEDAEGIKDALRIQADLLTRALREEDAIDCLGSLLEMTPGDQSVRRRRIELMERTHQREAAAAEYGRLAEAYVEGQRFAEAEEAYQEILKLIPDDLEARNALITLYIQLERPDTAGDSIEELAARHLREGRFDEAVAAHERVFEFDPKSEETYRKIIAVRQRSGDVAGALACFHPLLDLLAEEGRSAAYEQTAREAITLDPSNWETRQRLIDHLLKVGRSGEAEGALVDLAGLQIKADAFEAATRTVECILEINNDSIPGMAYRAELMALRGDSETALKEFLRLTGSLSNLRGPSRGPASPFAFGNYEGLTRVKEYTFDHFVVGSRNNFAYATALGVARAPGKNWNPLFLYADVGLGKTHLCHAIANYVLEHSPEKKIIYTMTEDFIGGLIDSIQNNSVTVFRDRHRLSDILIIDDIQFLSGKERAQEEFFLVFNALFEAGKQIVITSDRPPKDIAHLEKRLRSRFGAGIIVDVQTPDLETRIAILRKELIQRGRSGEVTDDVVLYLAENIPSNIRDLKGTLNQLLARRDVCEETIDLELARQAVDQVMADA